MQATPAPTSDCGFMCSPAFFFLLGLACLFACVCSFVVHGDCDECLGVKKQPLPQSYPQYPRYALHPV